jgi:hypothetical protein
MLRAALRAPARADDALATVAAGGGLHLLVGLLPVAPVALAAGVVVAGFLVRALGAAAGTGPAPRFGLRALPGLARDGTVALLVAAVYLAVPVAVLAATAWGLVGRGGGGASALVVALGGTASLALAAPFAYVLPAALVGYAAEGRVRAAFDRGRLRRAAGDARYLVAVLVSAGALGVVAAAYGPLNRVALGFFVAFYAEWAVAELWGRAA